MDGLMMNKDDRKENDEKIIQQKLKIHGAFWQAAQLSHMPVSFRLGDYFFADKFNAALPLLKPGLPIEPDMLNVDDFLEDYERIFTEINAIKQSGFWTAEPFTGIPWMEAIMGCPVIADVNSFVTTPAKNLPDFDLLKTIDTNLWYMKYIEFVTKLVKLSDGRFPVGQPIMRGISDVLGAIVGQTEMIYNMSDEPDLITKLASLITDVFLKVVKEQHKLTPAFYGGSAMGFYHIWAPGQVIWFQEDLTALLSPDLYRTFILEQNIRICNQYEYSAVHLHSSSFHMIDDILRIKNLKAVEINKDNGGLSIKAMASVFEKVLKQDKRLIIWGNLNEDEILFIKRKFSGAPVFLNIVAEDVQTAKKILQVID